jgi:hypothetical protein
MSECNSQRLGTALTLPKMFVLLYLLFVLCRSVYCLCVNVYPSTANGWQPKCILTNILYHWVVWTEKESGGSDTSPWPLWPKEKYRCNNELVIQHAPWPIFAPRRDRKPTPSGNRTQVVQPICLVTSLLASPLGTTDTGKLWQQI